jgi:hypothetical protein
MNPTQNNASQSNSASPAASPQPPTAAPPAADKRSGWVEQLPSIIVAVSVLVSVVASFVVIRGDGKPLEKLELATGYALLIFLFFLSLILLLEILMGKINLSEMLDELSGGASMSRFQLLIFTIVVAFSFFIIVVKNADTGAFPDIPRNVLILLGLSASTYGVSKGLQIASGDTGSSNTPQKIDAAESTDSQDTAN